MRILIVEDDEELRHFLKRTLERESFAVDASGNGKVGSYMARTNEYDLVILDNTLPEKMGIEICADIRRSGKSMPILILSVTDDPNEKAAFLDTGADDYLTKPYSHKELIARIRALTRRAPEIEPTEFTIGDLTLNTSTGEVCMGKKEIHLTRKEFSLLELLMKHKGRVVSRGAILEHVWDSAGDPFSKTIETHIVNLRKKIEGGRKNIIVNVPGRGYKIVA